MVTPELWKQWKVTEVNLVNARRYLLLAAPELSDAKAVELQQFEEYLAHNELGLALKEIAALGEDRPCRGAFWRSLELAAESMRLTESQSMYRIKFLATLRGANAG